MREWLVDDGDDDGRDPRLQSWNATLQWNAIPIAFLGWPWVLCWGVQDGDRPNCVYWMTCSKFDLKPRDCVSRGGCSRCCMQLHFGSISVVPFDSCLTVPLSIVDL